MNHVNFAYISHIHYTYLFRLKQVLLPTGVDRSREKFRPRLRVCRAMQRAGRLEPAGKSAAEQRHGERSDRFLHQS